MLLTLLAHPEPNVDGGVWARLHQSLCHLHLRASTELDDAWANTPLEVCANSSAVYVTA
jgi:hypothetical protein